MLTIPTSGDGGTEDRKKVPHLVARGNCRITYGWVRIRAFVRRACSLLRTDLDQKLGDWQTIQNPPHHSTHRPSSHVFPNSCGWAITPALPRPPRCQCGSAHSCTRICGAGRRARARDHRRQGECRVVLAPAHPPRRAPGFCSVVEDGGCQVEGAAEGAEGAVAWRECRELALFKVEEEMNERG